MAESPEACCCQTHVFVLAGQSNAAGQGGFALQAAANLPGKAPSGLDVNLVEPYAGIRYAYETYHANNQAVDFVQPLGDLRVRIGNNGSGPNYLFGTEMTLGRVLNSCRPASWGPNDKVVLLKFASGGTSIDRWQPGEGTGLFEEFSRWLQERVAEIEETDCDVVFEDLFWIQGEADAHPSRAPGYAAKLQALIAALPYQFRPVFSKIKAANTPTRIAGTAIINAEIDAAGIANTGNNDDLTFLAQTPIEQHFNAVSLFELGRRLAKA